MKTILAVILLALSTWLYMAYSRPAPEKHPEKLLQLIEFYQQAATDQPFK